MPLRRLSVCVLVVLFAALGVARAEVAVPVQNLKPHQAWSKVERSEAVLIDVRTVDEWRQTGVPREAKRITLNDARGAAGFVAAVMKAVRGDNRTPVALICRSGNRSAKAAALLSQAGFKTVYNVTEGVVGNGRDTGWAARGLPMVSCGACAAEN
jgi:rhodanese-related sulfurtransferase